MDDVIHFFLAAHLLPCSLAVYSKCNVWRLQNGPFSTRSDYIGSFFRKSKTSTVTAGSRHLRPIDSVEDSKCVIMSSQRRPRMKHVQLPGAEVMQCYCLRLGR